MPNEIAKDGFHSTSQDPPAIEIHSLSRRFGNLEALKSIDLLVRRGEVLAIFGHNGAGKTTLLKILSTVMKPSSGEVLVNGMDIGRNPIEVRRNIGVISHRGFLYPGLTAYDNLVFYSRLFGVADGQSRARELLGRLGLKARMYDKVSTFSRGMSQRLAIARSLLHDPGIMLMDEPETGLDASAQDILWQLLSETPRTVVFTHHSLERGLANSTRVAVLARGRLFFCPPSLCSLAELNDAYSSSLEAR